MAGKTNKSTDNRRPLSPVSTMDGEEYHADVEAQNTPTSPQHSVSPNAPLSPRAPRKQNTFDSVAARKVKRSKTAKVFEPKFNGRSWKPGLEPGIDPHAPPSKAPIGLKESCEITVVDFSQDKMYVQFLDNDTLEDFLEEPRPGDTKCRWISVNGLSWDVISLLGIKKGFHRLAIEDMLNRRNRTKADWYSDHTYLVLPLQKLIHTHVDECDHSGSEDNLLPPGQATSGHSRRTKQGPIWRRILGKGRSKSSEERVPEKPIYPNGTTQESKIPANELSHLPPSIRTLQRWHGGTNEERTEYMEEHSSLRSKQLAVAVEQVSIFLCSDNTVVSFFEQSAEDIETPILLRLNSAETVLRRTSNASMIVQAIIDAIVDTAMPVSLAYRDAIDELELNVLTDPAIKHTRSLYVIATEISAFRDTIFPVIQLLNALRDHKAENTRKATGNKDSHDGQEKRAVTISPWSWAYFGDVEDHVVLITDNIDQQRRSVENLIDYIFNTISAYQNESMKQLTVVTIFFLPLSFLTGYFGMNFNWFDGVQLNSDAYFWEIASPVLLVVTVFLMRDYIVEWFTKKNQRRIIAKKRKRRLGKAATKIEKVC